MQTNFVSLTPQPSNKKALILAAVGVIAVVGVVYACFAAPTQEGINLARMPANYQNVEGYILVAFGKWVQKYNKMAEYNQNGANVGDKLITFAENFKAVKAHMDKGSDVKLELNAFADMTRSEFKAKYLSLDQRGTNANRTKNPVYLDSANLPDKVDWRDKGAVTPVKDQKQCGSCWAFSATGAMEGVYALKKGSIASFAEQQLVDCSWDYGNEGCNGGLMDQAFQYVADKGIQSEDSYKYTARDGDCKYDQSKVVTKVSGFSDVPANDENQLAAAVADHPVAVAIEADSLVFQFYSSGIISSDSCGTDLDHGVLAVGYDASSKDPKQHYWIVKNSWGSGWGDKGYVKILKQEKSGDAGICGIAEMASYPTL